MLARLERELTPEDSAGPALREAVDIFWHPNKSGQPAELRKTAILRRVIPTT